MTVDRTEAKSGLFAAMRRYYRRTRPSHGPVPKILPVVVVGMLAAAAYLLLDAPAAEMRGHWPGWLARPSRLLTDLGKSGWIIGGTLAIIAIGALVRRFSGVEERRRLGVTAIQTAGYIFLSVAGSGLISNILKRAIGRPRPVLFSDDGLFSLHPFSNSFNYESFPSGHATTCGAFWAALALLLPSWRWPLLLVGLCLALTRIFVGAHFPSDVLVGFGWGMWFAFFIAVVFSRCGLIFTYADGKLGKRA